MDFKSIILLIAITILFCASGSLQQNFVFGDASVISTIPGTIALDNTLSPEDAELELCDELASASAFLWYKIEPASSLRIFTFDTCNVNFDSVIGVFSGTSFETLETLACNDDRVSAGECNSLSSRVENISVASGETIYIVIGGHFEPTPYYFSEGTGDLEITVIDPSSLQCSADLILQVQQDLQLQISTLETDLTTSITSSTSQLQSDISSSQTAITTAITNSESNLSADLLTLQSSVDEIDTVVDSTSTTVSSISTLLTTVDGNIDTIQSTIDSIDQSIIDVSTTIDTLSTSVTNAFTNTNTNIDDVQSTADSILTIATTLQTENDAIDTQLTNIALQLTDFETSVDSSFTSLESDLASVNSDLVNINSALSTIDTDLNTIDSSINSLGTSLNTLSTNVDGKFTDTNTNIDDVQSSLDQIIILSNQISSSGETIETQNTNILSQILSFETSVDTAFTDVMSDISDIVDDVSVANTNFQSSFTGIESQINDLQIINNDLQSDLTDALSILDSLQTNIQADSSSSLFISTIVRYLSDSSVTTPLALRTPNTFGGRMNDAAAYVISQYSSLKAAALLIGAKDSSECLSDPFCNYFLNSADPAYSNALLKFNSNVRFNKFRLAYSYLQQAFISLYPSNL